MKKSMLLCVVALVTLLAPYAEADPVIVLLPDGTAWYNAGDGSPTILVKNVIEPPPGVTPKPPVPDDPKPDNPSGSKLQEQVTEWASEIDDSTGAAIMSKLYEVIADNIESGKIPAKADDVDKLVTAAADQALDMVPGKTDDKWSDLHDKAIGELGKLLVGQGGSMTQTQYVTFFRDVQRGIEATNTDKSLPPFLEPLLQELIKILLKMIVEMFG